MADPVLIVGIDGLQPSQITPRLMPNLARLSAEGVTFANHHAVFPSVTRVNAVSMLTGRYPGGHGLAGNTLVIRDFDASTAIPALEPELTRVSEKVGRVVLAPNLADILGEHGRRFVAIGTGSSGNAFLQNPNAERSGGATINPEFCLPRDLHRELINRFGPWPEKTMPNERQLERAVQVLTEYVVPEMNPAVMMFWSNEPDSTQHATGVGSEMAVRSLALADVQLGKLLAWLKDTGRDKGTDVFVISDHGYSTVSEVVDIRTLVQEAGFPSGNGPGCVVVAVNGNSVLFYVSNRHRATCDRLAAWLMGQPWCGPIVASEAVSPIAGTVSAALVGVEGERAPDLVMSFTWDSRPNVAGYAGHSYSASLEPGRGNHGSMSRHELQCVLVADGPSFKDRLALQSPSGNVDLAPTVLRVLGLEGGESMDGRALDEALLGGPSPESVEWSREVHEAHRSLGADVYRQRITVCRVGDTTYLVEGRGGREPNEQPSK